MNTTIEYSRNDFETAFPTPRWFEFNIRRNCYEARISSVSSLEIYNAQWKAWQVAMQQAIEAYRNTYMDGYQDGVEFCRETIMYDPEYQELMRKDSNNG